MSLPKTNAPSLLPCRSADARQFGPIHALSGILRNWPTAWWAREDSNLQPDRYERPALTIELRARAAMTVPAGTISYNITASATIAADDSPCVQNPASASGTLGTPRFGGLLITLDERFKLVVAANHGRATPCAVHGCGMLPDLRFVIGTVLASALLIVAAFVLAATVRVAHHRTAAPDDPWRTLAFTDPNDFVLLADRAQPTTVAKTEAPKVPAGPAVTTPDPDTTGVIAPDKRERPGVAVDAGEPRATPDPPEPKPAPAQVVAAIPQGAAEPVQATSTPHRVETPRVDDEPLEPSERVGVLPAFPTAGPGFVPLPLDRPIALPLPDPRGKVAAKQATRKKAEGAVTALPPIPAFRISGRTPSGRIPSTQRATTRNGPSIER